VILAVLGACGALEAKNNILKVTLTVPTKEQIDMEGVRRTLVTRFVIGQETPGVDLSKELVGVIRRDLHQKAGLLVSDAEAPALPEQPLPDLLANSGYWRRLAQQFDSDLVVTGEASFQTADRSGYIQVDEISPLTGQRVRRSRFVEREAFMLDMRVFFLRGSTGELLYEDHFNAEDTRNGMGYDRLAAMYDLFEQISPDILGVVSPRARMVQRNLFTE
jgi:hypothetical protein